MSPEDKIHIRPSRQLQERFVKAGAKFEVFVDIGNGYGNAFKCIFDRGKLIEIKDISYENETT